MVLVALCVGTVIKILRAERARVMLAQIRQVVVPGDDANGPGPGSNSPCCGASPPLDHQPPRTT
eukprot:6921903-Lingulodinium_polyedra.AAC.1